MSPRTETLRSYFDSDPEQPLRPILTSLNGDGSWLMSFPSPPAAPPREDRAGRKRFYHAVVDSWLKGPVFATAEAATTIRGWGHFDTVVETRDYKRHDGDESSAGTAPGVSGVPTGDRGGHWKSFHPGKPLPEWLSVFRLVGDWYVELATVLVWSHESGNSKDEQQHEFIINTPHGVNVNTESVVAFFDDNVSKDSSSTAGEVARPERAGGMECLAMLAGLKDSYSFGMRETVGVERSLQLERKAEPRYWVKSHDLPLRAGGAVFRIRMNKEIIRTLEYGLEQERKERLEEGKVDGLRTPNLVKAGNGGCLVLR